MRMRVHEQTGNRQVVTDCPPLLFRPNSLSTTLFPLNFLVASYTNQVNNRAGRSTIGLGIYKYTSWLSVRASSQSALVGDIKEVQPLPVGISTKWCVLSRIQVLLLQAPLGLRCCDVFAHAPAWLFYHGMSFVRSSVIMELPQAHSPEIHSLLGMGCLSS